MIVHQELWKGRVWAARPVVVVEDLPDRLLLWLPCGTTRKVPTTPTTRPDPGTRTERIVDLLSRGDWEHGDHVWEVSSLLILKPEDWHAVWVSWLPTDQHFGWYINLQQPYRRTTIGIESMDMMLDVVVEPDRTWRWKDRDEFEQIVERSIFDEATSRRVREEARAVIASLEANLSPFNEAWPEWRPDPIWPLPQLPPGWRVPIL